MKIKTPTHGMNVRDAIRLARQMGLEVRQKNATDDLVISAGGGRGVVQSLGRKDANRALTSLLIDLWRRTFGSRQLVSI